MDLTLNGSFADMVLLPTAGEVEGNENFLFTLTNPGQLHVYSNASLSAKMSEQRRKTSVPAVQYPMLIPIVEPNITVAKISPVHRDGEFSRALPEVLLSCYDNQFLTYRCISVLTTTHLLNFLCLIIARLQHLNLPDKKN